MNFTSEMSTQIKYKTANIYIYIKVFELRIVRYNPITSNNSCINKKHDQKQATALDGQYFTIFISVATIELGYDFFASLDFTKVN